MRQNSDINGECELEGDNCSETRSTLLRPAFFAVNYLPPSAYELLKTLSGNDYRLRLVTSPQKCIFFFPGNSTETGAPVQD